MKERELADEALCGCGSGAPYVKCCKSLAARFVINESGSISKIITPPAGGRRILKDAERQFIKVFGRKPGNGDLLLLAGLRYSPKEYSRNLKSLSLKSGISKAIIYATDQTGLVVDKKNYGRLSPRDREDWDVALDEYLEAEKDGVDLLDPPPSPVEAATRRAKKVMDDATLHFGSYLNRRPSTTDHNLRVFSQYLIMVKCFWLIKCLADRWDEITPTENAALVRGIYECTLLIGNLSFDESFSEELQAQAFAGLEAFPYRKKTDGSVDYSKVVCAKTGKTFPSRSSFKECARKIGAPHQELFIRIYPLLSNQVHFDAKAMISNLMKSGSFLMWDEGESEYVAVISLAALVYLSMTLINVQGIPKSVLRDIAFLGTRISDAIDNLLDAFNEEGRSNKGIEMVLEALFNIDTF